ncbi:hypothetical protein [Roseomonas sp. 18066]|uniref:hypothetical protein n=1 Tax=Roseomonas sp. 18066 TaxID=2681412 RepID=UPI00135AEB35|nr:hypothetical protein [Roseomonas sp. 18066]
MAPDQPVRFLLLHSFKQADLLLNVAIAVSQSPIVCPKAAEEAGITVLDGFALLAARAKGVEIRPLPFRPRVALQARLLRSRRRPLPKQAEGLSAWLWTATSLAMCRAGGGGCAVEPPAG